MLLPLSFSFCINTYALEEEVGEENDFLMHGRCWGMGKRLWSLAPLSLEGKAS